MQEQLRTTTFDGLHFTGRCSSPHRPGSGVPRTATTTGRPTHTTAFVAAVAAARYLCPSGLDLTTPSGWAAAVRSYNHSDDYVTAVLSAANGYAR